ncbi:MAG: hypothetical protein ACREBG_11095 [Pyrinomonadaceae bacterium]
MLSAAARSLDRVFSRLLLALLVCAVGSTPACRHSQVTEDSNSPANASRVTSSTPPFATREPDRYQAVRIITRSESSSNAADVSGAARTSKVSIARDGEKRREEYFAGASEQVVYLEGPAGRFILLPGSGLYADLTIASDETALDDRSDESPGLSADQLLNEAPVSANYERLGAEMLSGRSTIKYRVTADRQNVDPAVKTETYIWIDDGLSMPVRSEMISISGERSTKVTMELKDIRLETDDQLFAVPTNYKKVDIRLIRGRLRGIPGH